MARRLRLGDMLVAHHLITEEVLSKAIAEQEGTGVKLGKVLVSRGDISEDDLLNFLAKQLDIPLYDLKDVSFSSELVKTLSEAYARRFRAIVISKGENGFLVGMADPLDITAADELIRVIPGSVSFALVREDDLLTTLDLVYRRTQDISGFAQELGDAVAAPTVGLDSDIAEGVNDAPVIKLISSLFEDAVQVNASDIHVEPFDKKLRLRLRVDGVLQETIMKESSIINAIVVRFKLMANLNIAEKRLPQDGRFSINVRNKVIDIRLSTLPTQYGESVVMRLLDQSSALLNLKNIGMPLDIQNRFHRLISSPHGVVLVTGPTGSGKSTTLYGALSELNSPSKKIITVEDPVEYRLDGINQVHINTKVGLDFSKVLRTCLRQDPDIIMVGEMRDHETASIAIRAALTGHLVLSTLHTNDSASSALRLIDMGIEGFLVATTLRGILAQRLVRKICVHCKEDYQIKESEMVLLQKLMGQEYMSVKFKHGRGCAYCHQTGYRGRTGVYELLEMNLAMIEALQAKNPVEFSRQAAIALKGKLLINDALKVAVNGITTLSEVVRVAGDGG